MKFQTWHKNRNKTQETFTLPSTAVPDDTMTIAQIVQNFQRGLPINGQQKQGIYLGDEEIFNLNMDNIDKQDALFAVQGEINAIRSEHAERQKQKKQKQSEDSQKKSSPPTTLVENQNSTPGVAPSAKPSGETK